jgi:hypothetical protein
MEIFLGTESKDKKKISLNFSNKRLFNKIF